MTVDKSARTRMAVGPVGRIHDGDTFVMEYMDLGWGFRVYPIDAGEPGYCSIRVCLPEGGWYDAPEVKDKIRSKAAVDYITTLIPVGTKVSLISYGFSAGRTVAAVTLPDGRDLATLMIAAGHTK